jgi:hypothetical protein
MVRYLLVRVALPAAVINFAVNWAVGEAILPAGPTLSLWGSGGMAGDTMVGAYLIASFSLLLVTPGARREARSGRVRGWGREEGWLAAPARWPVAWALGGGLVIAILLGGPALWYWAARGVEAMDRDGYVWIKAILSAGIGVAASIVGAVVGVAPERDVSGDVRWRRGAIEGYPCEYLDKGGLAATDRARGCSATPTWHLAVRGSLEPDHVRRALADLLVRYPSLATRVTALDGVPPYASRFRYARDAAISADALFAHHDLRGHGPEALAALLREHRDRYLDPFVDPPLTLTLATTDHDTCHVVFRQHHAIADGRAFIGLLGDFAGYLDAARAGRRPSPEALAPIGRRGELEALGLSPARQAGYTLAGLGASLASSLHRAVLPLRPLRQNRSDDYTGANETVHRVVPDTELARWKSDGKRQGVSVNSWLTGALLLATQRWHRQAGLPLGRTSAALMMETRPRDPAFASCANHLATLEVLTDLRSERDLADLARTVQVQVDAQRRRQAPIQRFLIERLLVRALPLDALHRVVFASKRPSRSLDFSNLIALPFPALGGDGWAVDQVLITTPVIPRAGIVLTVIHYRGQICFNFNFKASAVGREEVEALADHFDEVLGTA